jgi:DinB family protein
MSTAEFIRSSLRQQHGMYNDAISDLTEEQLHWSANDKGLPASFILWHYVRTEDNIIQFVLQRKPTIWLERGLHEKFGLPANAQGTGMSHEDAQNLRLDPKDAFYDYMQAVWQATDDFLANTNDEALQQMTTVKPLGEMPVQNAIGNMCLTHGFTHLGEIAHLRGLMGLRGMAV